MAGKMVDSPLMISVSGVRGIVGRSLTPELIVRLGQAYGTYIRSGRVVAETEPARSTVHRLDGSAEVTFTPGR